MIKLYICCLVLIIGSVEVGSDIDMKFHQEVMEIVSYDSNNVPNVDNCSSNTGNSMKMPWLCVLCKMCDVRVCIGLVVIVAVAESIPKSITIPVPDLNKPRQEKEGRPTSVLSNFDVPLYEEVLGPKEVQPVRHSMSVTPGLTGMKCGEGARPKDSFKRMSAFQDYMSAMMSALNNPWKP